jgi:hypothetical protein
MRRIELKSRKLLRRIFGGISLTAVAFVFQACYGPGPDPFYDVKMTGRVVSKTTNKPIEGIKVAVNYYLRNNCGYGYTNGNGEFNFYASVPNEYYYDHGFSIDSTRFYRYTQDSVYVHFLDVDGIENGEFADTIIIINPAYKDEVRINVALEEKQ